MNVAEALSGTLRVTYWSQGEAVSQAGRDYDERTQDVMLSYETKFAWEGGNQTAGYHLS